MLAVLFFAMSVLFIPARILVFPLIFHSIQDEIPETSRPLITRLYQLWLVLLGTLIVNMVACIIILISGSPAGGSDLGGSLGSVSTARQIPQLTPFRYLILITPLSFLLWYRCALHPLPGEIKLTDPADRYIMVI